MSWSRELSIVGDALLRGPAASLAAGREHENFHQSLLATTSSLDDYLPRPAGVSWAVIERGDIEVGRVDGNEAWGVSAGAVAALAATLAGLDEPAFEAHLRARHRYSAYETPLFYHRKLIRLVRAAAAAGDGLLGEVFEDW
jgi:hypothetical protein